VPDDSTDTEPQTPGTEFRSGFVSLVGRPNVGKSTLLNQIIGRKVSIVSDRPQTTRTQVRGVRTTPNTQIVFLDTPGVHRPRTLLGERTNDRAITTLGEVDVVCFLIEANAPIGPGDRFVAARLAEVRTPVVLAVNKIDVADREAIVDHLAQASGELGDFAAFVPLSAREGDGVDALLGELESRLPPGPHYYPEGQVSDQPESFLAAELVREQLLAMAREELPHSIAVTPDEVEERETADGPLLYVRVIVRVERDSQKGIVIGHRGERLREIGARARVQIEALLGTPVFLDLRVKVLKEWQRDAKYLNRLGF
jgi:GTP-binding protein Era